MPNENKILQNRIDKIRHLSDDSMGSMHYFEASLLAQSVLHDTVGGSHPLMASLKHAYESGNWDKALAASRGVIALFDEGGLTNPRLAIAHEIEEDILDIAQSQVQASEVAKEPDQKRIHLAISAFLTGASLEDALRRLCDARDIAYDTQRTSISKLQAALYQPSKQIEIITSSENKHITVWGDIRNKADHGKFTELTHTEVLTMVLGVRAFIDKHLP